MKEVCIFLLAATEVALVFLLVGWFFSKVLIPIFKN